MALPGDRQALNVRNQHDYSKRYEMVSVYLRRYLKQYDFSISKLEDKGLWTTSFRELTEVDQYLGFEGVIELIVHYLKSDLLKYNYDIEKMISDGLLSLQVLDIPEVQQLIELGPR